VPTNVNHHYSQLTKFDL